MSQVPPPPPPTSPPAGYGAPAPQKSGVPKWVWAVVGCGGLIFLLLIGSCLAIGWAGKKAVDKVQEVSDNPMKVAEWIVRANPDLELVESDADAGTITIREKSSGKVSTFDFEDIKEGKFRFETEDGESTIDFSGAGEDGGISVQTPEGTTRIGAGGGLSDVPEWVVLHPEGTDSQSLMTTSGPKGAQGMLSQKLDATRDDAMAWFQEALEEAGFEVETAKMDLSNQASMATVTGKSSDPRRQISVVLTELEDGGLQVGVQYDGK